MRPTAAGRLLYPEAKQALAALGRAEDVVAEHLDVAGKALTIAASHTVGEFLLPGWLAGFRADQPRMRAQVEIINSPGVLNAVRDGDAEIGFVEGIDPLDGFVALTVYRDTIAVVVAADHRWGRRGSVPTSALANEPYSTREAGSGTRAVATAALARAGIDLMPTLEAASTQSVKRALADGGFSLLSPLAVEAEQRAGTLKVLPLRDLDTNRELRAVHDCNRRQPPLTRQFWRWLETDPASAMTTGS